jgi:2'-5' RNA ligase
MEAKSRAGRLFIAVPLSQEVREAMVLFLNRALKGEPVPGRAPKAHNWHLTLRFLGDIDNTQCERLISELKNESFKEPFEIVFGGLGAFPRLSKASVLWVGVDRGHDELCCLAASVDNAVRRAGLPLDDKSFSPHLTISRIRPPQRLDALIGSAGISSLRLEVRKVVLFRSHLDPSGARYEPLEQFFLPQTPAIPPPNT